MSLILFYHFFSTFSLHIIIIMTSPSVLKYASYIINSVFIPIVGTKSINSLYYLSVYLNTPLKTTLVPVQFVYLHVRFKGENI